MSDTETLLRGDSSDFVDSTADASASVELVDESPPSVEQRLGHAAVGLQNILTLAQNVARRSLTEIFSVPTVSTTSELLALSAEKPYVKHGHR